MQRGLQVDDVAAGHRDHGPAAPDARLQQRLLPVRLPDHDPQAQAAGQRDSGGARVLVHADDADAEGEFRELNLRCLLAS